MVEFEYFGGITVRKSGDIIATVFLIFVGIGVIIGAGKLNIGSVKHLQAGFFHFNNYPIGNCFADFGHKVMVDRNNDQPFSCPWNVCPF